jgi:RNA polymerase sigma factor (sigma-70 family)
MSRRFLFRLFAAAAPAGDHVSDRELLQRFVSARDSAAFELLVRRHADAVWAAGLRVVGNEADADDVFQAAFLALARKAGSVRESCVGGWLHRVAVNAALKLKSGRTPTVREGVDLEAHPVADAPGSPEQDELAAVVHQELARLPERYRLPVVLCDLEGQTHAEAAKALGWPVGSVSGRLSRARDILRDRLTRRGLAAPAAVLVAASAPASAINAATAIASGTVTASPVVSSLAEGVLSAMRTAKLKLIAGVVVTTGFVALAGVGTVDALTRPIPQIAPAIEAALPRDVAAQADPPIEGDWTPKATLEKHNDRGSRFVPVPTAFPDLKAPDRQKEKNYHEALAKLCPRILGDDPPAVVVADDTYRRLLKARLQLGRLYIQKTQEVIEIGNWIPAHFSELFLCLNDMRGVALELWGNDPKVLIPWLEEFVIMSKHYEFFFEIRVQSGNEPPENLFAARRHRLEAEAALWKAKKRG